MTENMGSLRGDAAIYRRVIQQMAEDRQRMAFWSAAARGNSIVTRWQSSEQRQRAAIAVAQAKQLRESNVHLLEEAAKLRQRLAGHFGNHLTKPPRCRAPSGR